MKLINWLLERLRERSTKGALVTLLGVLTMTGVISTEKAERVIEITETGQAIYHEGADSVASAIDLGTALYEEGKGAVIYAKDTATHFWKRLGAFVALFGGLFTALTKDAKSGREYEDRERALVVQLKARTNITEKEIREAVG